MRPGRIQNRGFDGGDVWAYETIADLVNRHNWTKGVEVGVYQGRTFRQLLRLCPGLDITGVDLYEPQLSHPGPEKWIPGENGNDWDHETYYNDMLELCKKFSNRARIIKDYSVNASNQFDDDTLDFVFIDADHSYKGVCDDIDAWSPKVRKGGMIIGHDFHFPGVKKAVIEKFGNDGFSTADDFLWLVNK